MLIYQEKIKILSNMCGPDGYVKPSGILDIFQTVAGKHANQLEIGMAKLYPNYSWVLMRIRYELIKPIRMESEVEVITWPHPEGKIDFDRDFLIKDLEGTILVKGASKWVVINMKTRRIERTSTFKYPGECSLESNFAMIEKIDCSEVVFTENRHYEIRPSDIDLVGHLNNTKYADLCYDLCPKNYRTFTINYNHEISLGENVLIEKGTKDGFVYIKVDNRFNARLEVFENEL